MEIVVTSDLDKAAKHFTQGAQDFADKMVSVMRETIDESVAEFQSGWRSPIASSVTAGGGDETDGEMAFTRLVHTRPIHPKREVGVKVAFVRRPANPNYRPVQDQVDYSSALLKTKLSGGG